MVARVRYRLLRGFLWLMFGLTALFLRLPYDVIRLIAKSRSKVTMPFQHLFARKQVFAVSCAMRRNLGRSSAFAPNLVKTPLDLRTPGTRCFQILP